WSLKEPAPALLVRSHPFGPRWKVRLDVDRGVGSAAPTVGESADVHRVIAECVRQLRNLRLRRRVVTGDGQGAAIGSARWSGKREKAAEVDVVEGLDHARVAQVPLHKDTRGHCPSVT